MSAGRKACSASRPSSRRTSALFNRVAKLGFIGTAWMFSTPVAMLETSTRSPPMCRAMSARSGMVATTLIFDAAGASAEAPTNVNRTNGITRRFIAMLLSAIPEAVDVAAENDRPLQEELVLVEPRLLEARVLETQTLELREPQRQVRRVSECRTDDVVDVLRVV